MCYTGKFFFLPNEKLRKWHSATRNQDKDLVAMLGGIDSIRLNVEKRCRSMSAGVMSW